MDVLVLALIGAVLTVACEHFYEAVKGAVKGAINKKSFVDDTAITCTVLLLPQGETTASATAGGENVRNRAQRKSHRRVHPKPPEDQNVAAAAAVKAPEPPQVITVVLKVPMHCVCDNCPKKIKQKIRNIDGVESAEGDLKDSIVTVKSKYEPQILVNLINNKLKRNDIVKEEPKKKEKEAKQGKEEKKANDGRKKAASKGKEKKEGGGGAEQGVAPAAEAEQQKQEEEPPRVIRVVLKVHMHCEACPRRIKRVIRKMKGVDKPEIDRDGSQVTVKGVFEPQELVNLIHKKLNKNAEIVEVKLEKKEEEAKQGKESIAKMWFEWSEHSGNQDFAMESLDVNNCGDLFLESPRLNEDVTAIYKR